MNTRSDFEPGVRIEGVAENDVDRLHIVLHLLGEGAQVRLVAVHHAIDQVDDVLALALGDGDQLVIQRDRR
jgi:hypothetical protein